MKLYRLQDSDRHLNNGSGSIAELDTNGPPMSDLEEAAPTLPDPIPLSGPSAWDIHIAHLRARYPKATESVLFCIHVLQQDGFPDLDAIKARAQMYGLHVTGASLAAAQRQLAPPPAPRRVQPAPAPVVGQELPPRSPAPAVEASLRQAEPEPAAPTRTPRPREWKPAPTPDDLEQRLVGAIENLTKSVDEKNQRMRQAIAEAVRLLQDALEER